MSQFCDLAYAWCNIGYPIKEEEKTYPVWSKIFLLWRLLLSSLFLAGRHTQAQSRKGKRPWPGCLPRKSTALPDDTTGRSGDSCVTLSVPYPCIGKQQQSGTGAWPTFPWISNAERIKRAWAWPTALLFISVVGVEQCWVHVPLTHSIGGLWCLMFPACLQILLRAVVAPSELWGGSSCSLPTITGAGLRILLQLVFDVTRGGEGGRVSPFKSPVSQPHQVADYEQRVPLFLMVSPLVVPSTLVYPVVAKHLCSWDSVGW